MKKLLLLPFVGFFITACSVDPLDQVIGDNINEVNATLDYGCAGPDNAMTITYSEAASIDSWDEVRKLYISLLGENVFKEGTFDPSIWDLINRFNDEESGGLGDYTTEYFIDTADCKDSVILSITVIPDEQEEPICEVDAGSDNSIIITKSEADAIESWDEVRKLYLSLLEAGVTRLGEFDPSIWDLIYEYRERGLGNYTTEYTIKEGDCTDTVLLTVTVVQDEQSDPTCEGVNAGPDNTITLTFSEAAAIESWDEVRKLYLSLLASGVPGNGAFHPSIWDLINNFQEKGIGEYATIYTITEGECSDTVTLTIIVVPD